MFYSYYYWRIRGPRFTMNEPAYMVVLTQDSEILCNCSECLYSNALCYHIRRVLDRDIMVRNAAWADRRSFSIAGAATLVMVDGLTGTTTESELKDQTLFYTRFNKAVVPAKGSKLQIVNYTLVGYSMPKPEPEPQLPSQYIIDEDAQPTKPFVRYVDVREFPVPPPPKKPPEFILKPKRKILGDDDAT